MSDWRTTGAPEAAKGAGATGADVDHRSGVARQRRIADRAAACPFARNPLHGVCLTVSAKRVGGRLPLGDGRVGVPHLVFPTGGIDDAQFIVSIVAAIDAATAAANAAG